MTTQLERGAVATRVAEAAERADRLDPVLGSFLRRFRGAAATEAGRLDTAGDEPGPLHGMLIAVKDILATADGPTTCQSLVHDPDWHGGEDALVVRRLRAAGAVIVGKTTMAEHALSRPDSVAPFPVPRNPWDPNRWTGGSSCGSANGLAAGLFDAGVGTDSNGSIRIPAALCGVTGLKPTHGLLPSQGCRPLSRSMDTVGPLARTARDCARLVAAMAGRADKPGQPRADLAGVRIGVPFDLLEHAAALTDDCRSAFDAAVGQLRDAGAEVVPVQLPETFPLIAAQMVTLLTEAFEVHGLSLRERWADFGRPFRWNVVLGGLVSDEIRQRAQRVRRWGAEQWGERFADLDAVATPTWPTSAPRYDDPAGLQAISWLPSIWSAVGFPAIAMPMGFDAAGLPLSLQLAGKPWHDFELAAIADVYQQHTDWHLRTPDVPVDSGVLARVASPEAPVDGTTDPAQRKWVAEALGGLGVPATESDIDQLTMTWTRVSALSGMLPEL